ncbi:MAG TPA: NAD(P)/FAD-dependent oxidoreductase [Methanotrichaceae archaeon]|nr:NAD(P)/FAD-dependent oxidoreductase [Methanotrichaceae archaeon]
MKCDLVVVGAGPAGSMAAKAAASAGLDVVMIEKRQEIGDPVRCAEGVSKEKLKGLVKIDPRWIAADIKGSRIFSPDGASIVLSEEQASGKAGYVLERKVFDRTLAMDAALAGAKVMVKTRALGLIKRDGQPFGIKALRSGEALEIEAPLVIGADGVESKVGRWAGIDTTLKPKDIEVAAQFLVQDRSIEDDFCHFYLGNRTAPGAYAWIFPKGDKLANVGLGVLGSRSGQGDPLRLLQEFVKSRLPDGKILEMDVGGVPVAPQLDAMTSNGVMLVGDAAHHSDPLTGGGIINGMVAGELAGRVAAKAVSSGDVSRVGLKAYEDSWKESTGKQLQRHYELKEFFVKLTDDDLNALLHSLIREDTSKMDLRAMLRALLRLNPKLLWSLRHQII